MYRLLSVVNNTSLQKKEPGKFSTSSYGHYYEHANRLQGGSRIYTKPSKETLDYWYSKSTGSIYGSFGDGITAHARIY